VVKRNPLRELLNRVLWSGEDREDYEICFTSRGELNDVKCINGIELTSVSKYGFEFNVKGGVSYVPFHRVREVRRRGVSIYVS